jgi:hypothetical protein
VTRVGEFGGLPKSRRARVAALEDDCHPTGCPGAGNRPAVHRAFRGSCSEPGHAGHVTGRAEVSARARGALARLATA